MVCALFAILSPFAGFFIGAAIAEDTPSSQIVMGLLAVVFCGLDTAVLILLIMVLSYFFCPQAVTSR